MKGDSMGDFDKYLDEAKDLAKEAGEAAKTVAGEVVDKAKKLTEEGSAAREIAKNAKEQATAISAGIRGLHIVFYGDRGADQRPEEARPHYQ